MSQDDVTQRIKDHLASAPAVLFMKGTPDFPQCGFSAQTVAALRACNARFNHVTDITLKWHGSTLFLVAVYACPGPNAISPSFEDRFANVGVWNNLMDEAEFLFAKWNEFNAA